MHWEGRKIIKSTNSVKENENTKCEHTSYVIKSRF